MQAMAPELEKNISASEDRQLTDVLEDIKEVKADIKRIKTLPENHQERARLPALDQQLAEYLKEKNNLQIPGDEILVAEVSPRHVLSALAEYCVPSTRIPMQYPAVCLAQEHVGCIGIC